MIIFINIYSVQIIDENSQSLTLEEMKSGSITQKSIDLNQKTPNKAFIN